MMPNARGEPLWWDVAVTPILGTDGQPCRILAVSRDITAGHAAEDMMHQVNLRLEATVAERTQALSETASELAAELKRREEAQTALLQAQKLEALGQLTSGVAHDFNNMLAAIQGSFTLLTKRAHDETAQKLIRNGRQASDRAAALIRHLLAFARREDLQPVVVDPAGLLPGVGELVRQSVGRRVTLVMEPVPEDTWRVLVEAHQLEVALLNLAVNARDAMPEGGVLTISARNMPAAEPRPPGVPAGDCVALQVRDTGTGMSPEVLARATEAFFTTKDKGQGTGLGLAMVQRMAQQLGGTLHIDSTLGLGTTMSIILPRADLRLAALPSASAGIDATLHGNAALLVVDDDEQVRMVTAGFLRDLGYTVIEAANAQAAYALALAADAVDLVVSDVAMPGADGPSLVARLRLEWPDLPIIFVTGFAGDATLAGETVLAKPYAFPDLAQLVAERLGRGEASRQHSG
jgi:signal transduction histidine kinase